jgi:endonuclease/exonuclease/phosphatase family metal-dependent hydrolase
LAPSADGIGLGIYTKLSCAKKGVINVINIHGVAKPGDKKDNLARLKQSTVFLEAANKCVGPTILGGDFNLDINTESIKMIEEDRWTNLIRNYGIKTTRNELTWKKYPDSPQYYADYVFIKNEISIKKFEVPRLLISDHEPMILEII